MNCVNVQRVIDEAERPDLLPFGAARHVDSCTSCHEFSEDRIRLAALLGSIGRVTAPANFDDLLRLRMRNLEVRRRDGRFGAMRGVLPWHVPANYIRTAGFAMTLLLVAVI